MQLHARQVKAPPSRRSFSPVSLATAACAAELGMHEEPEIRVTKRDPTPG